MDRYVEPNGGDAVVDTCDDLLGDPKRVEVSDVLTCATIKKGRDG